MKKSFFTLMLGVAVTLSSFAQTLTVDTENAEVSFKVVSEDVTGTITGLDASITFNTEDLGKSSIKGSIPVSNISTGISKRDDHLLSEDYFHAEKHPKMEFESSKIEKTDKGYLMTGKMTIVGVTKDVRINFTYEGNTFVGKTVIYTNDFDLAVAKNREDSKVLVKFTVPVK